MINPDPMLIGLRGRKGVVLLSQEPRSRRRDAEQSDQVNGNRCTIKCEVSSCPEVFSGAHTPAVPPDNGNDDWKKRERRRRLLESVGKKHDDSQCQAMILRDDHLEYDHGWVFEYEDAEVTVV